MYTDKLYGVANLGTEAAIDLTSAATQTFSKVFLSRFRLQRIGVVVTTLTSSAASIVVNFYRRPTYGSDVGRVLLGAITIPTAAAVGKCYYKDISDQAFSATDLNAGEQLVYAVGTAATVAGQGVVVSEGYYQPEAAANQSNMVASA